MRTVVTLLIGTLALGSSLSAAADDLGAIRSELLEMNRIEQEAFVSGDCETLGSLLDEEVSFFANGRRLDRDAVVTFCARIPRPFPETGDEQTAVHAISADAGYIVKTMTFPDSTRVEIVTKIWRKQADGWKIEHFQSTVTDLAPARGGRP